jgi:putative two-component system response regulator
MTDRIAYPTPGGAGVPRLADAGPHEDAPILVVDDLEAHREVNELALRRFGYRDIRAADSGGAALAHLAGRDVQLVVLDLGLPDVDGYGVLRRIRDTVRGPKAPNVLVVTADGTPQARRRALAAGANDVIVKPVNFPAFARQVRLLLDLRTALHRFADERGDGRTSIASLRSELARRIADASRPSEGVAATRTLLTPDDPGLPRADTSDAAAEARMRRVGTLAALVALRLGWPDDRTADLQDAACLYDVGVATMPAGTLAAEGSLSEAQRGLVREHGLVGEAILATSDEPLFTLAAQIARHHHERWDGAGYPDGLQGDEIPLAARIFSACDAYDAMTHGRPHRAARTSDQALAELRIEAGRQFDPKVVVQLVETLEAFPELAGA